MRLLKLRSMGGALCIFGVPAVAFAYSSSLDFPAARDGSVPALASDHGQSLDFGFAPSRGLGLASEGYGATLNESQSLQRPMAQPKSSPAQNAPSEFERDFYGIR